MFKAGNYTEAIEEYSKAMAHIESLDKAAASRGGPVAQEIVSLEMSSAVWWHRYSPLIIPPFLKQVDAVKVHETPALNNLAACYTKYVGQTMERRG